MRKLRQKLAKPAAEACQALGAFEAAAVLGVHYATPARMVSKGLILARMVPGGVRTVGIFDGRSCEQDYLDYVEKMEAGGTGKRPRAYLDLRSEVLARLKALDSPISFADAITTSEAAAVLSVHNSFIPRMIDRGDIVGRRVWSPRGAAERVYIVSRSSCVKNGQEARREQAGGKKVGRPRNFS
jgi:hypothetical protein